MSASKRIFTLFVVVALLISTQVPTAATAQAIHPSVPASPLCATPPAAKATPQRLLFIGGLLSEAIDQHLRGLIAAADPACPLVIESVILPAT